MMGLGLKKYASFFRIRFQTGLQYRAAAAAGIITQFAWGAMEILIYSAFYRSNPHNFPMGMAALSSYIWLQQAFLALFMVWFTEADIFDLITSGNVAYELCRPMDLYAMWFLKSAASRAAKAALRSLPILLVAAFLPTPYGLSLPKNFSVFLLFLLTLLLGFLLVVSLCQILYIINFYTLSSTGIRIIADSIAQLLSGALIPLPFFPEPLRRVANLLPFASMQNLPLRIWGGDIAGQDAMWGLALQLFWLAALLLLGRMLAGRAVGRVIIQGG